MSLLEDEYKEEDYDQQKTETVKVQKAPLLIGFGWWECFEIIE